MLAEEAQYAMQQEEQEEIQGNLDAIERKNQANLEQQMIEREIQKQRHLAKQKRVQNR